MAVTLGARPDILTVYLTGGSDFAATLTNQAGAWDAGAVVTLVFATATPTTWTATISGADAMFNVDKAESDAIPDRTRVELRYVLGDFDQVWARGKVSRHD